MRRIAAATLRSWIMDGGELALLDAREEGEFGTGHLFWAVPCPLSRREERAAALLPRIGTRIVCVDDGRGLAEKLADYLAELGATDIAVLDGGTPAWNAAGFVLFTGVNVPSKAFGEWAEHHYGTESVDAAELHAWLADGRDMIVLDSRPMAEFHRMSIPTGINVPGGELAYRIGDLVPDPDTLIVVNCAGRTRSIMGAESLRRAGVPNRVVALRNGTMGWELAGFSCARGRGERYPAGKPITAAVALERAAAFAQSAGVRLIGPIGLAQFTADPTRTCYVLDVRDPAEFGAGYRPGSVSAPGGQLIQGTDTWVGVRGARIALIDDDGVRARMSAAWLRLMGHRDVFVVEGGLDEIEIDRDPVDGASVDGDPVDGAPADGAPVDGAPVDGALVIDLAVSVAFREGHIPGAVWGVRSRLDALRSVLQAAERVVLTSSDGALAHRAAAEARGLTRAPVAVLAGGTAAWIAAGGKLEADSTVPADADCIDFYLRPYDRNSGIEAAMKAYLSWEIDLVREIARDGTASFGPPG